MNLGSNDLQPLTIVRSLSTDQLPSGWSFAPLNSVARMESGHTPSRKCPEYWGGDIPWISLQDTDRLGALTIDQTNEKITALGIRHSSARILPPDTVVFCRTASVGLCSRMSQEMSTSQDFVNYVCSSRLDPRYLVFAFLGTDWRLLQAGSTHSTIYMPIFRRMNILLPNIVEQQAIVEILDDADVTVRTADALIQAKQKHKVSIAERLLKRGDVWKEVCFGEIFDEVTELNHGSKITNVITVGKYAILPQSQHFNREVASSVRTNYRIIRRGMFVYDPMSAYYGAIGQYKYDEPGIVSPAYRVIALRPGYSTSFLRHLIKTDVVRYLLASNSSQGNKDGKRRTLRRDAFGSICVHIPDFPTQQRIAECLDLMDEEISLLRQQRDALHEQKRGLMQLLLTGQKRVKGFMK